MCNFIWFCASITWVTQSVQPSGILKINWICLFWKKIFERWKFLLVVWFLSNWYMDVLLWYIMRTITQTLMFLLLGFYFFIIPQFLFMEHNNYLLWLNLHLGTLISVKIWFNFKLIPNETFSYSFKYFPHVSTHHYFSSDFNVKSKFHNNFSS